MISHEIDFDSIRVRGLTAHIWLRAARPSLPEKHGLISFDTERCDPTGLTPQLLAEARMQSVLEDLAWTVNEEGEIGLHGMRVALTDQFTGWQDQLGAWWCSEAKALHSWLLSEDGEEFVAKSFDPARLTFAEHVVPLLVSWLGRWDVDGERR